MSIITDGHLTKIKIIAQQAAVNQKLVILPVNTIHAEYVDHNIIDVTALHMVPLAINVLVSVELEYTEGTFPDTDIC